MRMCGGLLLSIVVVGASAKAAADSGPPGAQPPATVEDQARSTAVYLELGMGAPLGVAGIEAVHRFGTWFELSAGVGEGAGGDNNQLFPAPQWSLMPRLRVVPDHRDAITIGLGASGGQYGPVLCFEGGCGTRYVVWMNLEVGTEHWFSGGFALRYFLGFAQGCTTDSCTRTSVNGASLHIPYAGFGIGYAFGRQ
jgi:hypothetical protein